jgi:hypothetical protein
MAEKLGMALSRVLFEHEPKLLQCDMEASARAAAEVSNLLGCIMATVLTKSPQTYEAAFRAVILKAHESAQKTSGKALAMTPNVTPH